NCKYKNNWKLKIHDKEEREPPHVTIYGGGDKWRWALREKRFMDKRPPHHGVHKDILDEIKERWVEISYEWNLIHADNPVHIDEDLLNDFFEEQGWNVDAKLEEYNKLLKENEKL
ncbi:hypothetical protein, partial [uncultured Kiloniella sp.]|uniref:hypothetical protein n=1 Tax=uncultured Kiloniella sp. TaxID=1133091 RepID=UPI002613504A